MKSIMGNMLKSHAKSQDNFPTAASILNIPFKILFLKWLAGAVFESAFQSVNTECVE